MTELHSVRGLKPHYWVEKDAYDALIAKIHSATEEIKT